MAAPSSHRIPNWDIAFIGMGAAHGILLQVLHAAGQLTGKSVVIFEPSPQVHNDKTYCFWAADSDDILMSLGHLTGQSWSQVKPGEGTVEALAPLRYHRIDSASLYASSRELAAEIGAEWKACRVGPTEDPQVLIDADGVHHHVGRVFDSRPPRFPRQKANDVFLLQSFVGYKVRLEQPDGFEADAFTMMDFRVDQGDATRFVYVLPYSPQEALIELTQFGKEPLERQGGERELAAYIEREFPGLAYQILDTEVGSIPMTTMQPLEDARTGWTTTGMAAGMLKPSTGYAFKSMFEHAQRIARSGDLTSPPMNRTRGRFAFYDHLLLLILLRTPHLGRVIFERLFRVRSTAFIMRFLDERTGLLEEAAMFSRLPVGPFLRAVLWRANAVWIAAVCTVGLAVLNGLDWAPSNSGYLGALGIGMAAVGIPHGALDAHLEQRVTDARFYALYLAGVFAVFLCWWWSPSLSLFLFLMYSAFHFGESDVLHHLPDAHHPKRAAWLWGSGLLSILLLSHPAEVSAIVAEMGVQLPGLSWLPESPGGWSIGLGLTGLALWATRCRFLTKWLLFFAGACWLPVWVGFGMYFVGIHSTQGWGQIRNAFHCSHRSLFLKALPFNVLSWIGLLGLWWLWPKSGDLSIISAFFLLIAGISLPHIVVMHRFNRTE